MSASAVLQLQKAGFSTEQVEALANFMDTQAASAADLERATASTHRMIADVRNELKADIADIRSEMRMLEQRMTIKLGGMMIVAVGVLMAAMRFMPPGG